MPKGIIKALKVDKGFGFIEQDDGGPDLFFHASQLVPDLDLDPALLERRVEFSIVTTPKGPAARNVRAAEW